MTIIDDAIESLEAEMASIKESLGSLNRLYSRKAAVSVALDGLRRLQRLDSPQEAPDPRRERDRPEPPRTPAKTQPARKAVPPAPARREQGNHPCSDCEETFRSAAGLGSHRAYRHPAPSKPVQPAAIPAVKDLPAPPKLAPPDNDRVKCSCGLEFPNREAWNRDHNSKLKPSEFRDHKLQVAS